MFHVKQKWFDDWGFGSFDFYNPDSLMDKSINQLRKEYARLRKEANVNINELLKTRYAGSEFVKKVSDGFQWNFRASKADYAFMLSNLASFLNSQRSTVSGYSAWEKNIQQKFFQATGVEVPLEHIEDLREFMQELREAGVFKTIDSERAVDWFENFEERATDEEKAAEAEGVSRAEIFMEMFDKWLSQKERGL